jgi:hypothetical protein
LANTAWAFATAGVKSPELFDAIAGQSERLAEEGTEQALANTAWAFATAGVESPELFDAIAGQSERLAEEGNVQNMANTAWAFAAMDEWQHSDAITLLWSTLCGVIQDPHHVDHRSFIETHHHQMIGVAWASQHEAPELDLITSLPVATRRAGQATTEERPSRSHREISSHLERLGWEHDNELPVDEELMGNMMALDMACSHTKVAVEFHGPSHYVARVGREGGELRENGTTRFKARVLKAAGWRVATISVKELIDADGSGNVDHLLREKMAGVGVSL